MTTICCVCKKVKCSKGWEDLEISFDDPISHGYCPKCYRKWIGEICSKSKNLEPKDFVQNVKMSAM